MDWEGDIIHDVLDNVFFCLVFVLVQVICVQFVVEKSYGSVFVLGWVVGGVWDDNVECTTQRREDYTHTHQEQELPDTQETEEEY